MEELQPARKNWVTINKAAIAGEDIARKGLQRVLDMGKIRF